MTDWIEQDDWSKVEAGDTVRVTQEEGQLLIGKVAFLYSSPSRVGRGFELEAHSVPSSLHILESEWTLWVPAKPAVVLPTEPGWYLDNVGVPWELGRDGCWWLALANNHERLTWGHMGEYAPMVRLAPVAETAKKVLNDVSTFAWADGFMPQLRALGIKYGSISE